MTRLIELGLWGANFLLWFGLVALVEVASYWFLRAPLEGLSRLREILVILYLLGGGGIALALLLLNFYVLIAVVGTFVVFSALQTILEHAILPRYLNWKEQFWLSLITYYCLICNGLIFIVFISLVRSQYPSSGNDSAFLAGNLVGWWLTPLSISFFRWMMPQLRMRPGVDRSLNKDESLP